MSVTIPKFFPATRLAFAFRECVVVVVDTVLQFRIAEREVPPGGIELELEEIPAAEECPRGPDKQIAGVLRSERGTRETNGRRRHGPFPTELGIVIVRSRQNEQPAPGVILRVGNERGRPAHLLQGGDKAG